MQLQMRDWVILFLVELQIGELLAAGSTFALPWSLWATVAAVAALAGVVTLAVPAARALKVPAVSVVVIAFGGMLLTLIVRGVY